MKTHNIDRSNSFLPATKSCVTNRGENTWGISMIFDEYIYWVIVLFNGTTLLTNICQNGSKNHLQIRPAADCMHFCSLFRRYVSLFMRYISQVRRFVQPPWIRNTLSSTTIVTWHHRDYIVPRCRRLRWYGHVQRATSSIKSQTSHFPALEEGKASYDMFWMCEDWCR